MSEFLLGQMAAVVSVSLHMWRGKNCVSASFIYFVQSNLSQLSKKSAEDGNFRVSISFGTREKGAVIIIPKLLHGCLPNVVTEVKRLINHQVCCFLNWATGKKNQCKSAVETRWQKMMDYYSKQSEGSYTLLLIDIYPFCTKMGNERPTCHKMYNRLQIPKGRHYL